MQAAWGGGVPHTTAIPRPALIRLTQTFPKSLHEGKVSLVLNLSSVPKSDSIFAEAVNLGLYTITCAIFHISVRASGGPLWKQLALYV